MPASGPGHSRRGWGWYPLTDEWAGRVTAAAGVPAGALVLDLGAGQGALTRQLLRAGARVIAVELHPGRAAALRARFAGQPVRVVCADAAALRLPARPFRVVASPPYGLTAALLRLLLAPSSQLVAADIVLQRAAVRRYCAGQGPAGRRWQLRSGLLVPRRAFRPPPQVDSAVLVIRRR